MNRAQKFISRFTKKADTRTILGSPIIEGYGALTASYTDIKTREDYARTFSTVSEVYSPLMYAGRAFSNMKLKLFTTNSNGEIKKEIQSHEILNKLASPNPLNNWTDFLINYYVNKKVFGNAYILNYHPTGFREIKDNYYWVLPSQYVYPVPTKKVLGSYYIATDREKFIRGYNFFSQLKFNTKPTWETKDIFHQKEPNLDLNSSFSNILSELLEGRSPLSTLTEPITNIKKAYDAQNVILKKRGALGILSPRNTTDVVGTVTMTPTQKKEIQDQFQEYGLGEDQWQYIIANREMRWTPMSLPLKDLMLFEGIEASMKAICNTYNFPILLLNYLQGATYSNVQEIKKSLYQDNIIPEANSFIGELNSFLGLPELGLILQADYSHVPILQADAKKEVEKDKITIDTIMVIQESIIDDDSYNAAIAMMVDILSFSRNEANAILTKPKPKEPSTNGNTNDNENTDTAVSD